MIKCQNNEGNDFDDACQQGNMALAALWRGRNCFDQQPLGSWKVKIIVECDQKCCKIVLKAANVDFTGNT